MTPILTDQHNMLCLTCLMMSKGRTQEAVDQGDAFNKDIFISNSYNNLQA